MERAKRKPLLILDFDETIAEQDSARHFLKYLATSDPSSDEPKSHIEELNRVIRVVHQQGILTCQDISLIISQMTFFEGMDRLIRRVQGDFDLVIISASNVFFIESFLKGSRL